MVQSSRSTNGSTTLSDASFSTAKLKTSTAKLKTGTAKLKTIATITATFVVVGLFSRAPAIADTVILNPVKDNSLFDDVDGALSNGEGEYLFAGRTAANLLRRATLAFDVASALPANAMVTEVQLTVDVTKIRTDDSWLFELRRLLADWGEGTSDAEDEEGMGIAATAGDTTWVHTFFPSSFWTNPGGDFSAVTSGTKTIGAEGSYTWSSTPQMVGDVQDWFDNPASNFGWIVLGDESESGTAKRFNSRENTDLATAPRLAISFDVMIFGDGFESGDTSAW